MPENWTRVFRSEGRNGRVEPIANEHNIGWG